MTQNMESFNIVPVVDLPCETGEGPLWHEDSQTLAWIDIPAGTLYRYDPATGTNGVLFQHSGSIGGFTFQQDDSMVLFSDDGAILHLQDGDIDTIVPTIDEIAGSRFNDVIADPEGRVYCGTMLLEEGHARLYRLDPDRSLHLVYDDLTQANGMGFSPDLSRFYLTDSNSNRIYQARYDRQTGTLSDREVLIQMPEDEGVPDGMTVDADGTIWSARYGGSGIYRYSADGQFIEKIELPVKNVTSLAFAGPESREAYVTSASGPDRGPDAGDLAGALFRVRLAGNGRVPFRSRIDV